MEIDKTAQAFLGLGQIIRLKIFYLIVDSGEAGLRPQEIMKKIEIPQATLSFHLKQLLISELIWVERKGTKLFYHYNALMVNNLCSELARLNQSTVTQNNAIITKPRIKVKPHLSVEILKDLNRQ